MQVSSSCVFLFLWLVEGCRRLPQPLGLLCALRMPVCLWCPSNQTLRAPREPPPSILVPPFCSHRHLHPFMSFPLSL